MPLRLMILLQCILASSALGSSFSGNKVDDLFVVKSIVGKTAVTQGEVGSLKVGDLLYFARTPFKFKITAIKGNQVTVALPDNHDLTEGQNLMRNQTEQAKKAAQTESRLKQALED